MPCSLLLHVVVAGNVVLVTKHNPCMCLAEVVGRRFHKLLQLVFDVPVSLVPQTYFLSVNYGINSVNLDEVIGDGVANTPSFATGVFSDTSFSRTSVGQERFRSLEYFEYVHDLIQSIRHMPSMST